MKAIHGKLKIDQKYNYIDSDYQPDNATTCDNCNLVITTLVTLEGEDKRQYIVGSDCAEALQGVNSLEYWQTQQKMKKVRQLKSYLAKLKKADREGKLQVKDGWYYIMNGDTWGIRIFESQKCVQLFKQYKSL